MFSDLRHAGSSLRKRRVALSTCVALAAVAAVPGVAAAAPNAAFVTDQDGTQIAQFGISASQTLSVNGSASSQFPLEEAVTPNGKYLYATNYSTSQSFDSGTTVSQYSIGTDGTLTPLVPATVTTIAGPLQVAVSPDGKNAYVASDGGGPNGGVSEYSIAADGTLHSIGTITSGFSFPSGVAVSPDGSSVYVADPENGDIYEFDRASDGTLTPKTPSSVSYSGAYPTVLALTPDGKYLYASGSRGVDEFSVGSGGQLTALAVPTAGVGFISGLVVSPNGHNLYASACADGVANAIYQFSIPSNGELTPLTPPTAPMDGCGMPWMTASGSSLFAPNSGGARSVAQFSVSSGGALTPKTPATVADSSASDLWALVIAPDQGPVAKFTAKAKGKKVSFDATKSSDSDGQIVSYKWDFGDGHTLTSTKAKVSHTYKKTGKHTVTLTETDDSGCSTSLVFTGQTAYCNPGTPASHTVNVKAAVVRRLKLSVTPSTTTAGKTVCYMFTVTSKGKAVNQSTVTVTGHHGTTNKAGKTTLCLKLSQGHHQARATKSGYRSATAAIRVIAAPVFTG